MKKYHDWIERLVCALSIVVIMFSFSGTLSAQAQDPQPTCTRTSCPLSPDDTNLTDQQTANLKLYTKVTQKGFYVANGVGMVNQGYGTIHSQSLPAGSTVTKAYLYWAVLGPKSMPGFNYAKGTFAAHSITGTLIGSSPVAGFYSLSSGLAINAYAYRADVHAYVAKTGGGFYALTGFASGETDGVDPWGQNAMNYPLIDGATLVVIYSNPNLPTFTMQIYNGAAPVGTAAYTHLAIPGVNAVAPTGYAFTSFIGAEGTTYDSNAGKSQFFENSLPGMKWSGSDANGKGSNFQYGNVWDTMYTDLTPMVFASAPENDFWFSATTTVWPAVWVAQVLAYSSGAQDTDGDGLLDGWELNGINGGDLPAWGANPMHKDLFVEADYMQYPGETSSYLPPYNQLLDIVSVFANAPVNNPDGSTGIKIHIDTGGADQTHGAHFYGQFDLGQGNQVPFAPTLGTDTSANCSSYDWTDFQNIKNTNFSSNRTPIFHYMIFANDLAPCQAIYHISGISRNGWPDSVFIKGATDFIVSLGGWTTNGDHGSAAEREGTFIHELGHNLGLRHGGNDHVNFKPNYLSVMNYMWQTTGVWRTQPVLGVPKAGWYFDYSSFLLPTLNESALHETTGLGPLTIPDSYGTKWICPGDTIPNFEFKYATGALNWNCDGIMQTGTVKVDLNTDGKYTTLGSQNNWASITLKGGGIIGNASAFGEVQAQGPETTFWVDELKEGQAPPPPPAP